MADLVGVFFGFVNGLLMEHFEEINVFTLHKFKDSQSSCKTVVPEKTKSNSLRLKSFYQYMYMFHREIMGHIWGLLSYIAISLRSVDGETSADEEEPKLESCTKTLRVYLLRTLDVNRKGNITCSKKCTKEYVITAVPDTNLVLVVLTNPCSNDDCSRYVLSDVPIRTEAHSKPCDERKE